MSKITGKNFTIQNEKYYLKGYQDYHNKRLKIEDFRGNMGDIVKKINHFQTEKHVEKIIIKSRKDNVSSFMKEGYILEAFVPGYFLGDDGHFLCKYTTQQRYNSEKWMEEDSIVKEVWQKRKTQNAILDSALLLRPALVDDAKSLASFYASVFPVYPVPIEDPSYIKEQMQGDTIFHLIEEDGVIIAAASAEVNEEYKNAEITDCATLPSHRKGGYMNYIIQNLEKELVSKQIYCSYSIARALSFGMNAVLHNLQYSYTGRLKNNCYIFDEIEDMNVWCKDLSINCAQNPALDAGN